MPRQPETGLSFMPDVLIEQIKVLVPADMARWVAVTAHREHRSKAFVVRDCIEQVRSGSVPRHAPPLTDEVKAEIKQAAEDWAAGLRLLPPDEARRVAEAELARLDRLIEGAAASPGRPFSSVRRRSKARLIPISAFLIATVRSTAGWTGAPSRNGTFAAIPKRARCQPGR